MDIYYTCDIFWVSSPLKSIGIHWNVFQLPHGIWILNRCPLITFSDHYICYSSKYGLAQNFYQQQRFTQFCSWYSFLNIPMQVSFHCIWARNFLLNSLDIFKCCVFPSCQLLHSILDAKPRQIHTTNSWLVLYSFRDVNFLSYISNFSDIFIMKISIKQENFWLAIKSQNGWVIYWHG